MKIYTYGKETGEFLLEKEAVKNPLEEGKYLVPKLSTADSVIEVAEGECACYIGGRWVAVEDNRGKVVTTSINPFEPVVEVDYLGEIPEGYIDVTSFDTDENGNYYSYYLEDGKVDTVEISKIAYAESLAVWKSGRREAVSNIVVTYNGVEFQGDEDSQSRLSRSINGMMNTTETIDWIALDNTSVSCNKEDLQNILRLAGLAQATIWNVGRPIEGEVNG